MRTKGRIVAEHKERYIISVNDREIEAEITGNLRYSAETRADFPAVGDWVGLTLYDDSLAIIHEVLPRKSLLERQAVGRTGETQVIAANVDIAFIVQAVDRDFNLNRLERYLAVSHAAGVEPICLLNKIDLITTEELKEKVDLILQQHPKLSVLPFSNLSQQGYDGIQALIESGKTYCLWGSSGVGKSTLINYLCGADHMKTREISLSTQKGKHTTTHRELLKLQGGAFLIDTPGMREIGVTDKVESAFGDIQALAQNCRYNDCTHIHENGCAVLKAVSEGELSEQNYENYLKLRREAEHFQTSVAEKRKKDRALGKMYKEVINNKKKYKY